MDLTPYVENIQRQVLAAVEAGGDDARALVERLVSPIDAAMRLALQDALTAAAEEITCELAPGSVDLRLRGRGLEFVVTPAPVDHPGNDLADAERTHDAWSAAGPVEGDESGMSRINLRMPEQLKARVEQAASGQGLSVNAWLVRAAATSLERTDPSRRNDSRGRPGPQRYTGWAR